MHLPSVARDMARGLAAGLGFLAAWLVLDMPWWLASGLAGGVYWAASLVLPAPAPAGPSGRAAGLAAAELDPLVTRCGASATELDQLARQLPPGGFRSRGEAVALTATRLTEYVRKRPDSIFAALSLPLHLEQLLKMLEQYLELSRSQFYPAGSTVAEALRKVEQTVENATLAFEGMYRQLLANDVAALEASAASLDYLLGVQPEVERVHRQPVSTTPSVPNPPSAEPAAHRQPQLEKPT